MSYVIRSMRESDIDNVYAIEVDVHTAPWTRDILRDCVLVGYRCFVLEIQDKNKATLIGYIICRHHDASCHILNLGIAKPLQLKGYGRKLIQYVLDSLMNQKEIKYLILEVRPSNHIALHLYQDMGFVQIDIKENYYQDKSKIEDALLLKKIIYLDT